MSDITPLLVTIVRLLRVGLNLVLMVGQAWLLGTFSVILCVITTQL